MNIAFIMTLMSMLMSMLMLILTMMLTMMLMIERLLGSGRELSIIAGGCGASSQHP